MAGENPVTDLFGDPVLPRREGRGRPEVVWDRATSNRVLLCFARRLTVAETATVVGISTPTLRKVYFSECAKRREADLRLEMSMLAHLAEKGEAGDTSAIKELLNRLDKLRMRDQAAIISGKPKKAKPKGVKEQRREDAWSAAERDPDWGELLPTPAQTH